MIPRGSEGIEHLGLRIVADLIPKAGDAYTTADLGMLASLVSMVAQDYDRAADILLRDQEEIRAILREAEPHLAEGALRREVALALESRAEGYRVRQLTDHADGVMKVLIDLHAAVETAEDEGAAWAAPLNGKIWAFLENYVARRAYQSGF